MQFSLAGLLQEAVCEVFETAFFIDLVRQDPPELSGMLGPFAITALIPLAGEFSGLLAMHCSQEFLQRCIRGILPDGDTPSREDCLDAASEIINMIAGSMKRRLSSMISLFEIGLPAIVTSERHWFAYRGAKEQFPHCILSFSDDGKEPFHLEMLYYRR